MPPPARSHFDLLTHAPRHNYPNQKPESHAVKMTISETGLKTLGGVPSQVLPGAVSTRSSKDYRSYMHMNVRSKLEPCERFAKPVTSAQEYGWKSVDTKLANPQYGLKSCEETRINQLQILGPRHP
mmetsp:Transcript_9059/g.22689  ORF Transcript_9059/g.22689 Transcript_9059/m.22689 type:complete len:126 (+) Transcript_9059:252-629(+)|eukprot:CAMPEP_0197577966 /NCGR_PEP_ID=MMETSP1326-20131121/2391_1 /TAXON_ID=1155430 /ORGANISM="Genus nov. species nov., Strain RCC2288" /LENGTH=125 /DNA_ID=CAMNT_0043141103 /DNA_START=242 /DNA_END=619 /DNA_ORIENTATION=-